MKQTGQGDAAEARVKSRQLGEQKAQLAMVQLICTVSILRTTMTRVLPLAGCSTWWLMLVCLMPGLICFLLLTLSMRLTGADTLTELARRCLGGIGGWIVSWLLAGLLLLDGLTSLTALITMFTEGIGSRGTQLTLAILTCGVLLTCLHREGLPRGVYLLRWVMLAAALIAAVGWYPAYQVNRLFPMLGEGRTALTVAFRAGWSMAWPLVLLLTLPQPERRVRIADSAPILLPALVFLLLICLAMPHELLVRDVSLAEQLLTPARYVPSAARMLFQCLLMLVLFLGVGGAVQAATLHLCAPLGQSPAWLPYAALLLLTGTQALQPDWLWDMIGTVEPWLLTPLALLAAICIHIAYIRRKSV